MREINTNKKGLYFFIAVVAVALTATLAILTPKTKDGKNSNYKQALGSGTKLTKQQQKQEKEYVDKMLSWD